MSVQFLGGVSKKISSFFKCLGLFTLWCVIYTLYYAHRAVEFVVYTQKYTVCYVHTAVREAGLESGSKNSTFCASNNRPGGEWPRGGLPCITRILLNTFYCHVL